MSYGKSVFKAHIINSAEYEGGNKESAGTWLNFPTELEKINEALQKIGLPETAVQGQYIIDKCECRLDLVNPFIKSDISIYELSEAAERIDTLDGYKIMTLGAVMETPAKFKSLAEIKEFTYNTDYYVFEPEITDYTKLGLYAIYESGVFDNIPDHYKDAINLTEFGKHIAETEHGVFTKSGYLYPSGDDWEVVDLPFFRPNSLIEGVDDRNVDTTEKLAVDLDNFFRETSDEYEFMNDDINFTQDFIKTCIRTDIPENPRQMIYGMQNEYHLPDDSVRDFIIRLDKLKGISQEQQTIGEKLSIKKQLAENKIKGADVPAVPSKNKNNDLGGESL